MTYRVRAILDGSAHVFRDGTRVTFEQIDEWGNDTGFLLRSGVDDYMIFGDDVEYRLFKMKFGIT